MVYTMFIALVRMVTLRMKVMVCFRFGRLELALIRPERKHNSRAKPSILSKGFFMFLSYSQIGVQEVQKVQLRPIR